MRLLVILLLFSLAPHSEAFSGKRPNIILVLIDDLGWADSDLYGSGYYETPNMQRLAAEGMRFNHGYAASPLCSPTRASIMVGQHPARLHMTVAITRNSVFSPKVLPPESNHYTGNVQSRDNLPSDLRTLAEILRDGGYNTAHIGKWHLSRPNAFSDQNDLIYDAGNRGFDFVIGGNHFPGPPDYYSPYSRNPQNRQNWLSEIPNLPAGPENEYLDQRLAEEAIKWMDSVKDSGQPFFLNFWHYTVHTPIIPRRDLLAQWRGKRDPYDLHDSPEMAAMVASMDESLGILLDYLDRPENHNLRDNTLFVFLSDNGGVIHLRENNRLLTSNRPLRGGKANTYEGGLRVPWLVRLPGRIEARKVSDIPIVSTDLFPTFLDYASLPLPSNQSVDGISLRPLWENNELHERPLFFDFPHIFGVLCAPSAVVRKGDYKLLRFYWAGDQAGTHYYELYNLRLDPGEAINLASYLPEMVTQLDRLIDLHLENTNALIPLPNLEFEGDPRSPRSRGTTADRPLSLHLEDFVWQPTEAKGRRTIQLRDQTGRARTTSGLVLQGREWVQLLHQRDGSVEVHWDRSSAGGEAKILFGWSGGRSAWETNDWTLAPVELILR